MTIFNIEVKIDDSEYSDDEIKEALDTLCFCIANDCKGVTYKISKEEVKKKNYEYLWLRLTTRLKTAIEHAHPRFKMMHENPTMQIVRVLVIMKELEEAEGD